MRRTGAEPRIIGSIPRPRDQELVRQDFGDSLERQITAPARVEVLTLRAVERRTI
jgi:hypothetical protein